MPDTPFHRPPSHGSNDSKNRLEDHETPAPRYYNSPDLHTHLPSAEHCLLQRGRPAEPLSHEHHNATASTDGAAADAWDRHSSYDAPPGFQADHDTQPALQGETSRPLRRKHLSETLRAALNAPCLFYPGAGHDVDPALLFTSTGVVSTVVYADYVSDSMHRAEGTFRRFNDFCSNYPTQLDSGVLTPGDFGFDSPLAFYPNCRTYGAYRGENPGPDAVIGRWALFKLDSIPSRSVLFLYFCTEAIQTYINLWGIRGAAPLAVVVQNHGKGLFWTQLDGDCLLYAASPRLPKYIYVGDIGSTPWPGYRQVSRDRTDYNSMHRSRRALFECKSHFRINTRSPMLLWDGCSSALESETHPKFNVFKLTPPRDAIPAAGPD